MATDNFARIVTAKLTPENAAVATVAAAAGAFHQKCNEVRSTKVNWQSYLQGQMISSEDYAFMAKFDSANSPDARTAVIRENPLQCAKTFVNLMSHISKDQTVQYILTSLDDMLTEDPSRAEAFREYAARRKESVWTHFLNMLNRPDHFIVNQTARIITKIACWQGGAHRQLMEGSDLIYFLSWISGQLKQFNNEYLQNILKCLQLMLRLDEYRKVFVHQIDGLAVIIGLLQTKCGFQLQYQLTFCLWTLSFTPSVADKISSYPVIPLLVEVFNETNKEKLWRIILALFRNMLEKVTTTGLMQDNAIQMVQRRMPKQLELIEARKLDDEEFAEDLKWLSEKLAESVQDMSSFEEFAIEVRSASLDPNSPAHRSDRFWRENAHLLNEHNHELLKMLIKLLEKQGDPQTVSIAAHDIGEYVHFHPRGKYLVEQLGGKQLLMQHLTNEDSSVKYAALIAIQKLMVHNWEYLGKQIEQTSAAATGPLGLGDKKALGGALPPVPSRPGLKTG